jgi:ribonucleoside-diphosphate reductase alpha chain
MAENLSPFQSFIFISRYSRWLPEKNRRETWDECVDRWWNYFTGKVPQLLERPDVKEAILNLEVLPSMRSLMTAGPALDHDNTCLYNCSYLPIDSIQSFAELFVVLMNGTGVGYSVEHQYTDKLPIVANKIEKEFNITYVVEDSKEGWGNAIKFIIEHLYAGRHVKWDLSKIRPAGARLKTFGGRASGPAPLDNLFKFAVKLFYNAQGRRLTALECHDLCCAIANAVIVGGVRRSAMISLSDLSDREMALCKSGAWWEQAGFRSYANNSAVYRGRPPMGQFLEEWTSLYNSHSGERGMINRNALQAQAAMWGRDANCEYGTNPCSEIILKPFEFCNLSTVVVRPDDTQASLKRKIEIATIIGTVQSTFTNFPYLREDWKKNCEDERLLGVSMTGIFDNKLTSGLEGKPKLVRLLETLRDHATATNLKWADKLGIGPSKSITCVKPEGTTSCLVDSASGLHPRYAEYYFRRIRLDKKDPLYELMKDQGVPCEDDVINPTSTAVFTFAMKAPKGTMTTEELRALDHLDLWKTYQEHYCHHKPSITVNYRDSEFLEVGNWLWENFDIATGISFLPGGDSHTYAQAPFEQIDSATYAAHPKVKVNFGNLSKYEAEDKTESAREYACSAGGCQIV